MHRGLRQAHLAPGYLGPMDLDLVAETLAGEPAYRTRQVWEWTARGASSYAEMTNLSAGTRALLEEHVPFSTLELAHEATADRPAR